MIQNERSFASLFCETSTSACATLFYNKAFSDDYLFNHFVFPLEKLFALKPDAAEYNDSFFELCLREASEKTRELSIDSSFFVEDFLPFRKKFEGVAVEHDYRVADQMEILLKDLVVSEPDVQGSPKCNGHEFVTGPTKDCNEWIEVFRRSYKISSSWKSELKRVIAGLSGSQAALILAWEGDEAVGCLLLKRNPKDFMGVYCVGTVPEKRGMGVARQMLELSESLSRRSSIRYMTLQTLKSDNVSGLYKKLAYSTVFTRDVLQNAKDRS